MVWPDALYIAAKQWLLLLPVQSGAGAAEGGGKGRRACVALGETNGGVDWIGLDWDRTGLIFLLEPSV